MSTRPELVDLGPLISEAASVSGESDLERLLGTLVAQARQATGARYAALGVLGAHGMLSAFLYEGIDAATAKKIGHPPVGRGVLGTVIRENSPIVLDRIADHPDSVGFPEHHPPMETFLGVPVAVGDDAFGNIYLTEKGGGFTAGDLEVVAALGRIAGAGVNTWRLQSRLRRMAIIEDRQRIARDLHDSVIQDLFAVGLQLQGIGARIEDPQAEGLLIASIDTLDEAVTSLRRYILELREATPPMGLDERLQLLASRMGSAYTAKVVLRVEQAPSGDWDDEVVMLATEALSNALRHSGADHVEMVVSTEDGHLLVAVSDDGRGFTPADSVGRGMGLVNMRARAKSLGGELEVESALGRGTRVVARIPLSRQG